ncbi:recombinase family protein [uncultured Clostridium sp.]|uniref:recombinase family protein n=1 Tax=uncultured Clostridium sp. TaxID=59620 RepID=UPI0028EBA2D6|nr:recombinase family protein [uncultured Clostridium sp.]
MIKIAIYSRKSVFTGKGESIDNQIELCKNYCENYLSSNDFEYVIYEDEGFSGKNTNRPQFKALLNDIKSKKINILICYRLDRISRNVADFSSTLELLQTHGCDFISIKEQFDTSTPMGRAMIYIASVFAQLERETIAERVRDNMLQMAKMGKWLGGQLPLGFNSEKITYLNEEMKSKTFSKLIPIDDELRIITFIYDLYILKNSIREVTKELNLKSFKTKNHSEFDLTQVKRILRSPLYAQSSDQINKYLTKNDFNVFGIPNKNGYLTYNKKTDKDNLIVAVAAHKGVISSDKWLLVQEKLNYNKDKIAARSGTGYNTSLFSGLLKCSKCGANMVIKYNSKNKNGNNYIYYTCANRQSRYGYVKCDCPNLRIDLIDPKITAIIKSYNKEVILDTYNSMIKELSSDSNNKSASINLNSQISKKETQIHNLVVQLSNTSDKSVTNILMEQITNLSNEINNLKIQINKESSIMQYITDEISNIELLKSSYQNFNNNFDNTDDIDMKRALIRSIVESIDYYPDKENFEINFFGQKNMCFDNTSKPMDSNLYTSKRRCYCRFT